MTIFQRISQIGRLLAKWTFTLATRRAMPAMVCLLMLAAAAVAGAQTTYWVSPNGSDTNPGTYSEPFLTFQAAADAAQTPGDTVIFMDGTYSRGCNTASDTPFWDPPTFSTTQGWEYEDSKTGGPTCDEAVVLDNQGTASQPITFMAQHRGKAILDGEADWTETNGNWTCPEPENYLGFYNAQYVIIQGFTIQNVCYNAIIDNFRGPLTNALSPGLPAQGAQNITLRWNEFQDIGVHAHSDYGADGFYCGGNSPSSTDAGIPDPGPEGVVIDGNSIHDINPDPSVGAWDDHGLYINCPNVTITNNIFYNIDNGYDIALAGIELSGEEGVGDVLIANNTFGPTDPDNDNQKDSDLYSEISIDDGWGPNHEVNNPVTGITIQNNIFIEPRQNAVEGQYPDIYDCLLDANIVTNTAGVYGLNGGTAGNGCQSINEPGTLLDTGSGVMSDPDSPATGGYDLVSGSVAIDAGDFLAPPPPGTTGVTVYYPTFYLSGFAFGATDFARRCRPQGTAGGAYTNSGIDIGAYQYPQTCE